MIKESKYYSDEDNEDFENSTKYCICDNDHVDSDAKVRAHCHITGNLELRHIEIVISRLH